jgi:glycosyltransferase involved in cell wall biosynthesis
MPISLMEAMSMALPCIATDIRGCREEVVHGETGWIVPVRESAGLAERMLWMLNNAGEAKSMGERGRVRVLGKFDIDKVVAHELAIYDRLLNAKGLGAGFGGK